MSHSSGEIVKFVFIQCLCLCLCLQNSRKLVRAKSTNPGTCPIYVRTKAYPSRTFIFPPISSWFGHFADLTMPTGRSLVWSYPTLWSCLLENGARWTFALERIIKSIRALRSHVQQVVLKTQFFSSKIATLTCWDNWNWLAAGHNQFLSTCNVCNQYAILVGPLNTWP